MRNYTLALILSLMFSFGLSNSVDAQNIIASYETICAGDRVTLEVYGVEVSGWSNGMTGNRIEVAPVATTTYEAYFFNELSQSLDTLMKLVVVNDCPEVTISGNLSICPGQNTTLTATMGNSYLWSNGATSPSITISPVQDTDYWVEVTSADGCKGYDTVRVTTLPLPNVAIQGATQLCAGSGTFLTLPAGYSYLWSTGAVDSSVYVNPTTSTTYYVTVTNANGCSQTYSHLITIYDDIDAQITASNTPLCGGSEMTLTVTGGESYSWSHGLGTNATVTVAPIATTTYYVTVTDANGCSKQVSHTVHISSSITATVAGSLNICLGDSTTLIAGNADSYLWTTPNGVLLSQNPTLTVKPTTSTDYMLTVYNADGCSDSRIVRVTVHDFPTTALILGPSEVCLGDRITLTVDDANLYYLWSSGETTRSITVSPTVATTYSCEVTTLYGCKTVLTKPVEVVTKAIGSIVGDSVICYGDMATLTASGGQAYAWNTGENTPTINVTPNTTSTYTVSIFNENNCETIVQHVVRVNPNVVAQITGPTDLCIGSSVRLTANGGTAYRWESGETTKSIVVSPSDVTTYRVWVTSNGCESVQPAEHTITVHNKFSAAISGPTTVCRGEAVEIIARGGTNYLWNTGETTEGITVNPSANATYTCLISNGGICDTLITHTLTVEQPPVVTIAGNLTICEGEMATIVASGADQYLWSGDIESQGDTLQVSPTQTTVYNLTAIGANGCKTIRAVTVVVHDFADAYIDGILNLCPGASTTLTVAGNNIVSYVWDDGTQAATITVTPQRTTTYSVRIMNNNGCQKTLTATVKVGENMRPVISGPSEMCFGDLITLTAEFPDGSDAQQYQWSNGQTGKSISISPATSTTYTVTAILPGGCSYVGSHQVNVRAVPNVTINGPSEICVGEPVVLTATGAANYRWENGQTGSMITVYPTTTTLYEVTAVNNYGCETKQTHLVTVHNIPNVYIMGDSVICEGSSAIITAVGGDHYLWNNGGVTNTITVSPVVTTTYNVILTTSQGCDTTLYYTVHVNSQPKGDITGNFLICAGEATTLTATGGVSYSWSNGTSGPSITETPTVTTTYSVIITNAEGCSQTVSRSVIVNPLPVPTITGNTNICIGSNTQLTATGAGAGGYYIWSTGEQAPTIEVLPSVTSTYSVITVSRFGCESKPTYVTVQVHRPPTVAIAGNRVICPGSSTMLTAQGTGTSFIWNTGDTTASIRVTTGGTYTVQAYTAQGCSSSASITVTVEDMSQARMTATEEYICAGEVVTLTASGGDSYLWNDGSMTSSISVNPSKTTQYSVVVYSLTGCQSTITKTIYVNELVIAGNISICKGESTALTATGLGDAFYVWSNGDSTQTIVVNPEVTTTYTVSAYSSRGCDVYGVVTVSVYDFPNNIYIAAPDTICEKDKVVLTAMGGTSGTSYLWSTGARTASITVSPTWSQDYWCRYTAGSGCDTIINHRIEVEARPRASIVGPTAICAGDTITLTAMSAVDYLWTVNNNTSAQLSVAPSHTTTYELIAYSAWGCTDTVYHTVNVNRLPNVIVMGANTTCAGDSLMLIASDGTTTSDYYWSNGMIGDTIWVNLYATETLTVTCTNADGCMGETTHLVTVYEKPIPQITGLDEICLGGSTTITASGGRSYYWSTGSRAASIRVAPQVTTTYYVEVTGTGGCMVKDSIVIRVIPRPVPTVTLSDDTIPFTTTSICRGSSVTLMAHGAGVNGTYYWRNASSTFTSNEQSITVSPSVSSYYYLTVTTENGCTNNLTVRVNVLAPVNAVINGSNSTCSNVPVTLTLSGVPNNATVEWSTGATTRSISVNPTESITYSCIVTSVQGCDTTIFHTVNVGIAPNASIVGPTSICAGERVLLVAAGGDYFTWSNGITSTNIVVYPTTTTTYSCQVSNMNGCVETISHTVVVNNLPAVQIIGNTNLCIGDSLLLQATDGTNTTTYLWESGEITSSIWVKPLTTTTYTVIATTEHGCVDSISHTVTVHEYSEVSFVGNTEICQGTGTQITAYGGSAYQWSNGSTLQAVWLQPNITTTYWVDVTSAGGCVDRHYIEIVVNILPQASVWMAGDYGATNYTTICAGDVVSLEGHAVGNIASFLWMDSNGNRLATTQTIDVKPSVTTTYYLEVMNEFGCTASSFFVVYVHAKTNMNIAASQYLICEGGTTILQAGYYYDNLIYVWTEPDGTQFTGQYYSVSPMQTTTYSVSTITNDGCVAQDSITIQVMPTLTAAIQGPEIVCPGDSVILTSTEGDAYLWSNGATTQSITVAIQALSTYTVEVSNNAGCVAYGYHDIDVYTPANIIIQGDDTIFVGESTLLTATGADHYYWNNGQVGASITVAPIITTTYSVTGVDANGCATNKSITVVVDNYLPIILGDADVCQGESVLLTADAGIGATYLWSTGETTNAIRVTPLVTTTYTVSVVSQTGAQGSQDFTLTVLDLPIVSVDSFVTVCQTSTEVGFNFVVSYGNPAAYTIYFSALAQAQGFPATTSDELLYGNYFEVPIPAGIQPGIYELQIEFTNDNGCVGTQKSVQIEVLKDNMIVLKWDDVLICDNISQEYTAYQWYKNNRIISGAFLQYYSETGGFDGEYYVIATRHDGSKQKSCPLFFQKQQVQAQITMHPNPVQRFDNANLYIPYSDDQLIGASVTIHDMAGRVIERRDDVTSQMKVQATYPAGMYLIMVNLTDGTKATIKFIINE